MKNESYKPYPKNPNYLASSTGKVFSLYRMREVGSDTMYGYQAVMVNNHWVGAHRIVYEAWKGEIPKGYEINHLNGKKKDNRPSNLEAVTKKENIRHLREVLNFSNAGENSPTWKGYWSVDGTKYTTLKEAHIATRIPMQKLRKWCYGHLNDCTFIPVRKQKPG